jgi:hypothetical protein
LTSEKSIFTFIKKFGNISSKTFDPKRRFVMSSHGKLKIILGIILFIVLIIAGYLIYLYQKGGVENYRPPVTKAESPKAQVLNDLTALSQAVDAYHTKNLRYPERLEQLQPEFIDKIPLEPKTGKPFIYESDGKDQYQIGISDPASYGLKELFVKNGKIIQN